MPSNKPVSSPPPSDTKVKTVSRVEEVTAILRDEILTGQYRTGERLPSERDLAGRFEVNRGAIRESIKKLEQHGIVSINPGGVRVVAIEEASLSILRPLIDIGEIPNSKLIEHLFEVWGTLMSMAARSAVQCASEEQLQALQAKVDHMVKENQPGTAHQQWHELARLFTEINNNLVLRLILNGLTSQFLDRPAPPKAIIQELDMQAHHAVLLRLVDKLANRDADGTASAIQENFNLSRAAFIKAINNVNFTRELWQSNSEEIL